MLFLLFPDLGPDPDPGLGLEAEAGGWYYGEQSGNRKNKYSQHQKVILEKVQSLFVLI